VLPGLAAKSRVLTFDLRGHGASDSPRGPWTLDDFATDLLRLLDALGIDRADLVGHSGGGVIAMYSAIAHPERVSSLVLFGTASEANARAERFYLDLADKADARGGRAAAADLGWSDDPIAPDGAGLAHAARCMSTLHARPLTPRLAELRCPVTIAVGEKDFIGPGGSVILHRAIPGSRLHILEGRGHQLHLEDPALFAALVDSRLRPT
jgi:pimeloyl-ACP methyl ester carboxylesterase